MIMKLITEEKEYLNSVREFCQKEIYPNISKWEKQGNVDDSLFQKAGTLGYLGLQHPEEYGGSNASFLLSILAQKEVAKVHGSSFFTLGASAGLFGYPIKYFGTESQKEKYLPPIIRGKKIGCLAVTEPEAGSDVMACKSKVYHKNGKLVLSGSKTFITNAPIADYAIVLAQYHSDANKGLTHFIVDLHQNGVTRGEPMKKMGLKASPTGELFFDEVELTEDCILGKVGAGFRQTMQAFNLERLSLSTWCVGVMEAAYEEAKQYAKIRKTFGKPIYRHPPVAELLAEMALLLMASKNWLVTTANLMDELLQQGKAIFAASSDCAALKLFCSRNAREVTNLAVQIFGGAGYLEESTVCRLYQDIRLAEIGGGTNEIQKQIIARGVIQDKFLDL
ncbi:MAG: acyl-CoA dehydrogenase [Candidatus Hydrogenedentota bacterium]|nr:MAG: acyl-CoA dehydrogenase [Candidatus Hydrogenedentota bacterium]